MKPTEILTTHVGADFDAFASVVAARALYDGAVPVLPGSLNRNVREFVALYMHGADRWYGRDVDIERVVRVIVVDTQLPSRLGTVGPLLTRPSVQVVFWDHHPRPPDADDGASDREWHVEDVGATVTLLVESLQTRGLPVSPIEATLFALGIYEDTGSLLYRSTTERDLEALLWLRRRGADVGIVAEFLQRSLMPQQRRLLDELLAVVERHEIQGFSVVVAAVASPAYIEELDVVVNRLRELESADAYFIAVTMKERTTYLVARSSREQIDVARALARFGGGGHLFAASAAVHDRPLESIREELLRWLAAEVRPQLTAAEIMSRPVRTIHARTTVTGAHQLMGRFGYHGLPVVDEGRLAGVITLPDVERAMRHGLGHAPVMGYMSRNVVTATPDMPLHELQRLLIENNIGRLPVMVDGKVVGVVTTADVLRGLHQHVTLPRLGYRLGAEGAAPSGGGGELHAPFRDCSAVLHSSFADDGVESFLQQTGEVAEAIGVPAFLVGGCVRDLMLGRRSKDLDVVVGGGDAPGFAKRLAERVEGCRGVAEFPRYRTAILKLAGGWQCDIATARREFYPGPARPPEVDTENVRIDLFRRDFTMNAMAIALNPGEFGRLHDYYGGRRDLARGQVRILHNLSFIEDPTRVFRAVRFIARFGFTLEDGTAHHLRQALQDRALRHLNSDVLTRELDRTMAEPNILAVLKTFGELGILPALDWPERPGRIPVEVQRRCLRSRRLVVRMTAPGRAANTRSLSLPCLYFVFAGHAAGRAAYQHRCRPSERRRRTFERVDGLVLAVRDWLRRGAPDAERASLSAGVTQPEWAIVGAVICDTPADETRFLEALRLLSPKATDEPT